MIWGEALVRIQEVVPPTNFVSAQHLGMDGRNILEFGISCAIHFLLVIESVDKVAFDNHYQQIEPLVVTWPSDGCRDISYLIRGVILPT